MKKFPRNGEGLESFVDSSDTGVPMNDVKNGATNGDAPAINGVHGVDGTKGTKGTNGTNGTNGDLPDGEGVNGAHKTNGVNGHGANGAQNGDSTMPATNGVKA